MKKFLIIFTILIIILVGILSQETLRETPICDSMDAYFKGNTSLTNATFRCLKIIDDANTTLTNSVIESNIYIKRQGIFNMADSSVNGLIEISNSSININGTSFLQTEFSMWNGQIVVNPNSRLKSFQGDLEKVDITLIQPNALLDIGIMTIREIVFQVDLLRLSTLPHNITLAKCGTCNARKISLKIVPEFVKGSLVVFNTTEFWNSCIFVNLAC